MPKSFKHLHLKICEFENLYLAHRKARRGGKRKRPEVAEFEHGLGENLLRLHEELLRETYRPRPYRTFVVIERKERTISAAPYRDRVVHHALMNVVQPIFEERFIADSFACRAGKGTHRALDRAQAFARRYPFVLSCDVREFFPSVDHAILRAQLARHVACPPTLRLIDLILASGEGILAGRYTPVFFPGDDLLALARPRGLPIGNLTSQHWANVYLHPLDLFVKQQLRCRGYVRYSDDFVLFSDQKAELHRWRREIEDFLVTLRLTLHPRRAQVFPVGNGIDFLGWRVFPHYRRLRRDNLRHAMRRLRRQQQAVRDGHLELADLSLSVKAWIAHLEHGQTYRLRRRVLRQFVF
jgi:retron-type reverse transcriptase